MTMTTAELIERLERLQVPKAREPSCDLEEPGDHRKARELCELIRAQALARVTQIQELPLRSYKGFLAHQRAWGAVFNAAALPKYYESPADEKHYARALETLHRLLREARLMDDRHYTDEQRARRRQKPAA
jgi:hypothetical protein